MVSSGALLYSVVGPLAVHETPTDLHLLGAVPRASCAGGGKSSEKQKKEEEQERERERPC